MGLFAGLSIPKIDFKKSPLPSFGILDKAKSAVANANATINNAIQSSPILSRASSTVSTIVGATPIGADMNIIKGVASGQSLKDSFSSAIGGNKILGGISSFGTKIGSSIGGGIKSLGSTIGDKFKSLGSGGLLNKLNPLNWFANIKEKLAKIKMLLKSPVFLGGVAAFLVGLVITIFLPMGKKYGIGLMALGGVVAGVGGFLAFKNAA